MPETFRAFLIDDVDGRPKGGFREISIADLPDNDVLVEVAASTVNYKDGLAVTGRGRIARRLPMVAGVDLAGTVVASRSPDWKPGDRVIVDGWGLSETEWGAYGRFHKAKPEWLLPLPEGFSFIEAMAIGTAGYTAALCVDALERYGALGSGGEVLVTGAAGGVGSIAVALLAAAGERVVAVSGRPQTRDWLVGLGAADLIDRSVLSGEQPPLQKERWAAAVDTVGNRILANLLARMRRGGAVAACGLAGGSDLPATVFPFILRSVALLGVDSVYAPKPAREAAWRRLSRDLDRTRLASLYRVEPFAELPRLAEEILAGEIRGRVVLDVAGDHA
jgi:putative YhdH/YhfP family quinone oxidoreductase